MRTIANNSETRKRWPDFEDRVESACCKNCQRPLKRKQFVRAKENKHSPPEFCYTCLRKQKGLKTSRERKIERGKRRAREREAAKKGIASTAVPDG